MTVIGITGPSGAGKGAVSKILNEKYGFPVIDADKVYHSLVSSPSDCLEEIRKSFGDGVIDKHGALDRRELAKIVLGEENGENLMLLNSITHKYVVAEIRKMLITLKSSAPVCVIDAPLLIEAGLCNDCTFTLSVIADKSVRAERISARDGISPSAAIKRINSQKKDDFYLQNTDHSVTNNTDIESLSLSVERILSERRVI